MIINAFILITPSQLRLLLRKRAKPSLALASCRKNQETRYESTDCKKKIKNMNYIHVLSRNFRNLISPVHHFRLERKFEILSRMIFSRNRHRDRPRAARESRGKESAQTPARRWRRRRIAARNCEEFHDLQIVRPGFQDLMPTFERSPRARKWLRHSRKSEILIGRRRRCRRSLSSSSSSSRHGTNYCRLEIVRLSRF